MSKYYTWHDLELEFQLLSRKGEWPPYLRGVNVFGSEATLTVTSSEVAENPERLWKQLREWFGERIDLSNRTFILDSFSDKSRTIKFYIEHEEEAVGRHPFPLFGSFYNPQDITYPQKFDDADPKIFAFHSYKGGVGRTLSALSFCRSLSKHKKNGKPHRLLIIDADYEAPGITWLAREHGGYQDFSLFDALALVHEEENWEAEVLDFIASKIQEDRLRLPAEETLVEHFFLPAYRKEEQLLAIPVMPKHMVQFVGREWIIGDFLHKLALKLGVDAVVVDLRAGVSEFSAPLLFDPRVQKVLVTTTSMQAVEGTRVILKEIMERMPDSREYPLPFIFTSMVTKDAEGEMDRIEEKYLPFFKKTQAVQNEQSPEFMFEKTTRIKRLRFAQELVHLEDLEHIAEKLSGTHMEKVIDRVVEEYFVGTRQGEVVNLEHRNAVLKRMEELCTALNDQQFDQDLPFLKTTPIRKLLQKFSAKLPAAIVMGGVGAGKTFNFLQIVKRQKWREYVKSVVELRGTETDALIIPLLSSARLSESNQQIVQDCLGQNRAELGAETDFDFASMRQRMDSLLAKEDVSDTDWRSFWLEAVAKAVGYTSDAEYSFGDINRFLNEKKQKVVFVMDGFGELFDDIVEKPSQQQCVRVLCQVIVQQIRDLPNANLGIIAFLRKDLVQYSVQEKTGQFVKEHEPFEMKWKFDEILRLTVWIAQQSGYRDSLLGEYTETELLHRDILVKVVTGLWGQESIEPAGGFVLLYVSYSLFNYNGESQARDLVCLLGTDAHFSRDSKTNPDDRYLQSFVQAHKILQGNHFAQISREIPTLDRIFEKIKKQPLENREAPFRAEKYQISNVEIRYLESLGIVSFYEERYFILPLYWEPLGMHLKEQWQDEYYKVTDEIARKWW